MNIKKLILAAPVVLASSFCMAEPQYSEKTEKMEKTKEAALSDSGHARPQQQDKTLTKSLLDTAYLVSGVAVINAIGSHDPKAYGTTALVMSAMFAGFAFNPPVANNSTAEKWYGALGIGGAFAGFGLYNINTLAGQDLSTGEVFRKEMVATGVMFSSIIVSDYVFRYFNKDTKKPALSLQYDGKAAMLVYSRAM